MPRTYQLQSQQQLIQTKINYAHELNAEQLEVVLHGDGPCLVLAGAGSGKTRTLVYRVVYLLEQGVQPEQLMLVTFTNKASFEMLHRVEHFVGEKPHGLWGGTFHSLGNRVLRKYSARLGYTSNFNILDEDDAKSLLRSTMNDLDIPMKKDKYWPKVEVIKNIISFAENSCRSVPEVCEEKYSYLKDEVVTIIGNIKSLYQKKKQTSDVMDFDDLLSNWLLLLQSCDDARQSLASQFRYILVDEYQDTNRIQGAILDLLATQHKNMLVVGDDSQSIYSFRAANIDNILEFPKRFPQARTFRLETNYRSTPEILNLANASIERNLHQFEKRLKSVKSTSEKPVVVVTRDAYQQAHFVCQRILEVRDETAVSLREFAVLFRSAFQMIELELELNKRNIPYMVRGGLRFFEQAHIKDILASLRVMENFRDELAWTRLLGLHEGVGLITAQKLIQNMGEYKTLEEWLLNFDNHSLSPRLEKVVGEIQVLFRKIVELPSKNFIASAIQYILKHGYEEYAKRTYDNSRERLEDLEQLAHFSSNYTTLSQFLADVALTEGFRGERNFSTPQQEDERLLLTTIHQAKGLEWKHVFVIGLADGHFPHHKVYDKPQEMEEERRLFYVACTRAKDTLFLTYPVFVSSFQTGEYICRPSTFISELPDTCYEQWEIEDIPYDGGAHFSASSEAQKRKTYNEDGLEVMDYE